MASNWTRAIDSAQRSIVVERPRSQSAANLDRLTFHIQGVEAVLGGRGQLFSYVDMADRGVRFMNQKPLSVWRRLLRQPARIGRMRMMDEAHLLVAFWTQPQIDIIFNLGDETQASLWRECEIMTLSAGFHFVLDQ